MTNLRDKAREIKEQGVSERGNFEPTGAPKRLYTYWLNESNSRKAERVSAGMERENFCHFWRVVAIWAPLMFLRNTVVNFVESKAGIVISALVVLALLVYGGLYSDNFRTVLTVAGVIFIAAYGAISGLMFGFEEDMTKTEKIAAGIGLVVGLPTALVGFAIGKIAVNWNRDWNDTAAKIGLGFLVLVAATAIVAACVSVIMSEGWIVFLETVGLVLAVLVVLSGFVFGLSLLSDYLAGRRKIARDKRIAAINEMTYEELEEYYNQTASEPGKVAKFFSGVADFIILIAQVIRVKKWKICPMVTIETNNG